MNMRGEGKSPPRVSLKEVLVSWVGAFLGIFAVGFLGHMVHLEQQDILFLIGSFGASAVLLYGTPGVPLAQPRNLMGGHILSAFTGVLMYGWIADPLYLSGALSVATAIAVMHLTKTTHPPGGATALIAVIGSERVHQLGFLYVLSPVALGALIMLVVALIVNNLTSFRSYPVFWWLAATASKTQRSSDFRSPLESQERSPIGSVRVALLPQEPHRHDPAGLQGSVLR